MESIMTVVPYAQIVLSVLLVATVLLQQRGSSIGGAFGGDNFSATFHKRRGGELFLFRAAIVVSVLLIATVLLTVVY
jgi:protein translocase SecG subunit